MSSMLTALIDSVEQKKAQLDRVRPLSAAVLAQLQKHYDVELTYTSNAIEGNTLTLRETAEVIEHGITVGGKSLRDHLEAVDPLRICGRSRFSCTSGWTRPWRSI
jgi:Fic family protein